MKNILQDTPGNNHIISEDLNKKLNAIDTSFTLTTVDQYGLMPALYCFVVIAAISMVIAVWGLFEEK